MYRFPALDRMYRYPELHRRVVKPPLRCEFCDATEDLVACAWPSCERFRRVAYSTLQVGDLVRRAAEKRLDRPPARVVELERLVRVEDAIYAGSVYVRVTIQLGVKVKREKTFTVRDRSLVYALRDGKCESICCPLHRCERGPGGEYCVRHWRLQEAC